MSRRPWLGLALSLALHAGVIGLVLTMVARDEMLPALMVDLREAFVAGAASVKSRTPEERPAPPAPRARAPRAKKSQGDVVAPTPPAAPPSPPAAAPPPIVEAPAVPPAPPMPSPPPALPPAPASEPVGEPAPPPRDVPAARPSGSLAGPPTRDAPAPGGGPTGDAGPPGSASSVSSGAGGTATGSAPTGSDPAGIPRGESGQRVASVPPGAGGSGVGAEYGPYLSALRQRIQQSVRYPASARRRGLAGTVSVEILILANGSIGDVTLLESSSHSVLDEAALDTIRALPRMPLPPDLPARPLRVRVPVVFQMR